MLPRQVQELIEEDLYPLLFGVVRLAHSFGGAPFLEPTSYQGVVYTGYFSHKPDYVPIEFKLDATDILLTSASLFPEILTLPRHILTYIVLTTYRTEIVKGVAREDKVFTENLQKFCMPWFASKIEIFCFPFEKEREKLKSLVLSPEDPFLRISYNLLFGVYP